jgi:hypothetical protein
MGDLPPFMAIDGQHQFINHKFLACHVFGQTHEACLKFPHPVGLELQTALRMMKAQKAKEFELKLRACPVWHRNATSQQLWFLLQVLGSEFLRSSDPSDSPLS